MEIGILSVRVQAVTAGSYNTQFVTRKLLQVSGYSENPATSHHRAREAMDRRALRLNRVRFLCVSGI